MGSDTDPRPPPPYALSAIPSASCTLADELGGTGSAMRDPAPRPPSGVQRHLQQRSGSQLSTSARILQGMGSARGSLPRLRLTPARGSSCGISSRGSCGIPSRGSCGIPGTPSAYAHLRSDSARSHPAGSSRPTGSQPAHPILGSRPTGEIRSVVIRPSELALDADGCRVGFIQRRGGGRWGKGESRDFVAAVRIGSVLHREGWRIER